MNFVLMVVVVMMIIKTVVSRNKKISSLGQYRSITHGRLLALLTTEFTVMWCVAYRPNVHLL